jgi:DNA-directed RNA polymerase sigma subunit (sigma70/sigma32)
MLKPTVIDTPFPTLEDVARTYGISATRRKQLERQAHEFLTRHADTSDAPRRGSARKAARTSRKK